MNDWWGLGINKWKLPATWREQGHGLHENILFLLQFQFAQSVMKLEQRLQQEWLKARFKIQVDRVQCYGINSKTRKSTYAKCAFGCVVIVVANVAFLSYREREHATEDCKTSVLQTHVILQEVCKTLLFGTTKDIFFPNEIQKYTILIGHSGEWQESSLKPFCDGHACV